VVHADTVAKIDGTFWTPNTKIHSWPRLRSQHKTDVTSATLSCDKIAPSATAHVATTATTNRVNEHGFCATFSLLRIYTSHFILRWGESLKLSSETKFWGLINMQNVLNHVWDRSSHLTGKREKNCSVRFVAVIICETWSDLVWYLRFGPKFSVTCTLIGSHTKLSVSDLSWRLWSQRKIQSDPISA